MPLRLDGARRGLVADGPLVDVPATDQVAGHRVGRDGRGVLLTDAGRVGREQAVDLGVRSAAAAGSPPTRDDHRREAHGQSDSRRCVLRHLRLLSLDPDGRGECPSDRDRGTRDEMHGSGANRPPRGQPLTRWRVPPLERSAYGAMRRELAPVRGRRQPGLALEQAAEERRVLVADAEADVVDRDRARLEDPPRLVDPDLVDVLDRPAAGRRAEPAAERSRMQGRALDHRRDRVVGRVVVGDPRLRADDRRIARDRISRTIAAYGSWPSWCPARRWTFAVRIACSGPHSRAMTCRARSCQAVTPPAVITPSASRGEDEDRGRVERHARDTPSRTGRHTPSGRRTVRPSSSPASATSSEPVHTEAMSDPRACISRSQAASRANRPRAPS